MEVSTIHFCLLHYFFFTIFLESEKWIPKTCITEIEFGEFLCLDNYKVPRNNPPNLQNEVIVFSLPWLFVPG